MQRFAFRRPGANRALDLVNFFVADVQTGFGPFVAVYLTTHKWTQIEIGFALTLGTMTSLISQLPAGVLVDSMRNKRMAASGALVGIIIAALLLALQPNQLPVLVAQILHGFASCVITPAIAAISLHLAGHAALGERLGRNARFASIGNGLAAAVMGATGAYFSSRFVFFLTAALCVPALVALWSIGAGPHAQGADNQPGNGYLRSEAPAGRSPAADFRDLRDAVPSVQRRDAAAGRVRGHHARRTFRQPDHRRLHRRAAMSSWRCCRRGSAARRRRSAASGFCCWAGVRCRCAGCCWRCCRGHGRW